MNNINNSIEVRVDKRTELMGVLLLLSKYNEQNGFLIEECEANKIYRNNIFEYFGKFANHKAVKLLNQIIDKFPFGYQDPIELILVLDENLQFDSKCEYFCENDDALYIEFLRAVQDFYCACDFDKFYESNSTFYNQIIDKTCKVLNLDLMNKFNNEFYGEPFDCKCVINLLPSQTNGNYGISPKGELWANIGVLTSESEMCFAYERSSHCLYVHEFGHNIVNPIIQKCGGLPTHYFDDIKGTIYHAYKSDFSILADHIMRSIEYIYNKYYFHMSDKAMQKFLDWHINKQGFKYLPIFMENIEQYYLHINEYKSFEEFYPTLIENLIDNKNRLTENAVVIQINE
ncbi:MAG: DUF4932 domain-containing protein [Christensenellales bacterium]